MRFVFNAISYLFFPGTLAVAGYYTILVYEGKTPTLDLLWMPATFFLIAPVLVLFLFLKTKLISDIHVTDRKQRSLSYPIAIGFALLYVVMSRGESWLWWHWGAAVLFTLFFLLVINLSLMKASAHMAGTSGFLILTLLAYTKGESSAWVVAALLICTLVYLARKGLQAHTHLELWTGFTIGLVVSYLVFWF